MLCFEEVDWRYDQDEKIELLRYKNHYGDAPLRKQSYSLVRAHRSQLVGAANPKIISHSTAHTDKSRTNLTHSTRSLSNKSLQDAKKTQDVYVNVQLTQNMKGTLYHNVQGHRSPGLEGRTDLGLIEKNGHTCTYRVNTRPPTGRATSRSSLYTGKGSAEVMSRPSSVAAHSAKMTESRAVTPQSSYSRVASPAGSKVTVYDPNMGAEVSEKRPTTAMSTQSGQMKFTKFQLPIRGHSAPVRRVRSASDAVSLSEAKSLLRSEQRIRKEGVTRSRLLLTYSNIEESKKNTNVSNNTVANALQIDYVGYAATSVPSQRSCLSQKSSTSIASSTMSRTSVKKAIFPKNPTSPIAKEVVVKTIEHVPKDVKPQQSIHSKAIASTVPRANVTRPKTAQVLQRTEMSESKDVNMNNAAPLRRCKSETIMTVPSSPAPHFEVSHIISPLRKKKSHGWTTSHTQPVTIVPMLIGNGGNRNAAATKSESQQKPSTTTRLSMIQKPVRDPLTNHGEFQVRTRKQTEEYLEYVTGIQEKYFKEQEEEEKRMQRKMWLQVARGRRSNSVPRARVDHSK